MESSPKSQENQEKIQYPEISSEILQMADEDQKMRIVVQGGGEWDHTIDIRNTDRIKGIIEKIGWPTKSKVGEWPSYRAWLIVQHSAHDQEFMKKCLELMEAEPSTEIDPQNVALLSDRLKTFAGLPQTYGTQYKMQDGRYVHLDIEDPEHVDERRLAIGPPPIQEELDMINRSFETKGDT